MWLFQKWHWKRYEVAKVAGLTIQVSNRPFVSEYSNIICLLSWKPKQPIFNGWKWWNNHFLCKDWVHHPTETTIYINGCSKFQVYVEVFRDMRVWQQKTQKLSEDIWGYVTYTPWVTRVLQHLCSPLSSVFIPSNIRICHSTWATKQTLLLSIMLVVY